MQAQGRGRILIVDDQQNWRKALSKLLMDYEVHLAVNVAEAMQALERFAFDVVILDVRLVDQDNFNLDGIGLLKELRGKQLPIGIVILTAYPESVRKEILECYQPDELILKTSAFDREKFQERIAELVQKYRTP